MQRQLIIADLDETLIHTVVGPKSQTIQNSALHFDDMAVYYRPYLMEFLYVFVTKGINMELGLFTKGTKSYANYIIKQVKIDFCKQYPDLADQFDQIFQIRFYRENLNSDHKDLQLIADKYKIDINNILLVDDLISNFAHQPRNGIKIIDYKQIKGKDQELYKLLLYLQTFDPNKTLVEQNVFNYIDIIKK